MNMTPSSPSMSSKRITTPVFAFHLDKVGVRVGVLACILMVVFPFQSFAAVSQDSAATKGFQILEDIQAAITELVERVTPSVVSIVPVQDLKSSQRNPRRRNSAGRGSGVIIDADGHIVTNRHVVGEAEEVEVRLSDSTKFRAKVMGKDPGTDLAVIKIETERDLPVASFGDSENVKVGQWAIAVGNPHGLDRTVTLGVISGVGRDNLDLSKYENFIQTDASINPGNSGGPLFNLHGEVIGINTAIIAYANSIGFAVPSNMVQNVVQQLLQRGKVVRGWLGVGIQHVTVELGKKFGVEEGRGVLVNEVFEGDPAAEGGLRPGDIITQIDGRIVDTPKRLSRLIAALSPGTQTVIEVVRDHEPLELVISLTQQKDTPIVASLPSSIKEEKLGLQVETVTADLATKFKLKDRQGGLITEGVLISKVEPRSLAEAEGLRTGDLIREVNRQDIRSTEEFQHILSEVERGDTILLRILRESSAFYVVLRSPSQ